MTRAVCFKCGTEKFGPFAECTACRAVPHLEAELAFSIALCEHLSSASKLIQYAHELKNHRHLTLPDSVLAQARVALKDPQLAAKLGVDRPPTTPSIASRPQEHQRSSTIAPVVEPSFKTTASRKIRKTTLHRNPFCVLGATPRDDRRRIVELAEEKSLASDHELCHKARSSLTNPRTRLSAEMAWLPGVSPRKATQLADQILVNPKMARSETGVPSLAQANLLTASLELIDPNDDPEDFGEAIQEIALLCNELSVDDVLRDINEDRAVSGFSDVRINEHVESELAERKRYYRNAIKDALDRLPTSSLIQIMTSIVQNVTFEGEVHAPELIDELVDSYEVEAQGFLKMEGDNVHKLVKDVRDRANSGEESVSPLIDKLEQVARNWDKVAQPIQLSAKARGIQHQPSNELGFTMRSLAIDLFNEHDMIGPSKRIMELLQELFSELPELSERVEEDADALEDIFRDRKKAEVRRSEWEREITYRAEIGIVFKDTLSISPDGVVWKGQRYPLDAITRVRWGGVRRSSTDIAYTLAFGDDMSEAVVELRRDEVFSTFIEKLWRAVGIRLLTEMLEALRSGKRISVGEALVIDQGIVLIKHKFLGTDDPVGCSWHQTHAWTADGAFCIGAKDDKKTYVQLSYVQDANVHILEQAIHMFFKVPSILRLSDLLQQTQGNE